MNYEGEEAMLACEVRLEESVFLGMVESFGGDMNMELKRLMAAEPIRVFQQTMEPSAQLRARQLLDCPYVPALRNMYFEGKAMELLAAYMQLHLFDDIKLSRRKGKRLGRTDLDSVRAAAELLVERMDEPPTLPELSRMAGLSEYKLKAGFRELFDTTVFGYLRDKRMERALVMLEKEQVSVYEAAIATGYSNPSHFSSVFREKFGLNPSEWRKNGE